MSLASDSLEVGRCSLRRLALDQVCSLLASADPAVRATLFSSLSSCSPSVQSGGSGASGFTASRTSSTASPAALAALTSAAGAPEPPPAVSGGGGGGSGSGGRGRGESVGIPSSIGDAILDRAGEMECLTTNGVLDLLRWCTPRVFSLEGVSPTVTDSLLLSYPAESCAVLEEVRLGWCPHLLEVEAFLLKIRKTGYDGQGDEECALRWLDVSGNEKLSDGILKALAGRCPSLSVLKVDACPAITGGFLPRLAEGCPALTHLSAAASEGVTDAAMSTFIMESRAVSSGALRSLRLGGCPIGSLTAQSLLMRGSCLRELNLDGCSGLGDAAVRMLCRACPGLLELSLLGCPSLTCRGAWQCTQHPSVETLAITLTLLPGPELIPPEKEKPSRRKGGGGGGGGGSGGEKRAGGDGRDSRDVSRQRGDAGANGASAAAGGSSSCGTSAVAAGGGRVVKGEEWACARCTCLNPERRSTCQACRTPRGVGTPPVPSSSRSPSPSAGPPSPDSPRRSPRSSISPSGSRRGRRGRTRSPPSRSRSPQTKTAPAPPPPPPECIPLPLPAVPPAGPLRRLGLELAAAPPAAVATGFAVAAADAAGRERGGRDAGAEAAAAGFEFPLRRLAPLLPSGLVALDVWSSNAPPVPGSVRKRHQPGGSGGGDGAFAARGVGGSRSSRPGCGGLWGMSSAADDAEEAPAFEGAGGSKGGGKGAQRPGEEKGSHLPPKVGVTGVAVPAAPGDLISLSQACPSLQELVISGDPDQAGSLAASRVRIRGRGADAHRTTAAAGVHATAAAVAYFFRSRGYSSARTSSPTPPASNGSVGGPGGGGSVIGRGSGHGGETRAAVEQRSCATPLRVLAIFDCPSLPPLAVLEAVAMEGGAGLERLAVGCSKPPLPPPQSAPSAAAAAVRSTKPWRHGESGGQGVAVDGIVSGEKKEAEEEAQMQREDEAGGGRGGGKARRRGGGGGGSGGTASGDGTAVALSSEALRVLHVSGEGGMTGLALRCPRLETAEVVSCALLGDIEVTSTPTLKKARVENCRVENTALVALTKACWALETLAVSGNPSVGDPVVVSALAECPRLKTLRANGCRDVGGSPLLLPFLLGHPAPATPYAAAAATATATATAVAPSLHQPALSPLLPQLLGLEELAVSNAPGLTGAHVAALAEALPFLRRLSLSGCRSLVEIAPSSGRRGDGVTGGWVADGGGSIDGVLRVDEGGQGEEEEGEEEGDEGEEDEEDGKLEGEEGEGDEAEEGAERGPPSGGDAQRLEEHEEDEEIGGLGGREEGHPEEQSPPVLVPKGKSGGRRRRKASIGSAGADSDADRHDKRPAKNGEDDDLSTAKGGKSGRRKGGDDGGGGGGGGGGGRRKDKGEPRVTRKEARAAAKKQHGSGRLEDGTGVEAAGEITGGARGGKVKRGGRGGGGGKRGQEDDVLEDDGSGGDGGDVCQGLEFRVDGKTRVKLERLAAALPREPGRKQAGRPSCIRFLQDKCPNSAADCTWAHLPMHPPKTLKFKPLITHAQEPSSSASTKRNPAPRSQPATTATSRSKSPRRHGSAAVITSGSVGGTAAGTVTGSTVGFGGGNDGGGDGGAAAVRFQNLQFLEIHSCPGLKRLEGLRCPALAVARVTSCRELAALGLEEAPVLSHLDLSGCVRLEPWELPPAVVGGAASSARTLADLRVVVANYCRALTPKFLARLVDHARHLHRLEIYGAAVVAVPHGGGSNKGKEFSAAKRGLSRVEANRLVAKGAAILKALDKGRPKLTVVRKKKEFLREQEGGP